MTSLGAGFTAGYRSDGLRAWKGTGDARTYYLYDQGEPIIELDSKGNIQAMNVFAPDGLVGRWSMTGIWAKSWSYYVFDQQGNVDHRTDATGWVRSSSVYDAYGLDRANAGKDDPFGYNGRWGYYRDVETGLYLCQHRYYDPSSGRWLTRDPIGYAGGIGLYGYCGGGPVNRWDKSGLWDLPLNPRGLPGGWWQDGHGGGQREEGGMGRYYPPGSDGKDGLEFHPGRPGQAGEKGSDHWHAVDGGKKGDDHLSPGEAAPDGVADSETGSCPPADSPTVTPDSLPEGALPFWRPDNPGAWAAGVGIGVLVVGCAVFVPGCLEVEAGGIVAAA